MKRTVICIFCLLSLFTVNAQQTYLFSTNSYVDGVQSTMPTRNVEIVDDGVIVTYDFTGFTRKNDILYPNTYILSIDNFGNTCNLGKPYLPIRWDPFIIPKGKKANIELLDLQSIDVSLMVSPSRPLLLRNDTLGNNVADVPQISPYNGNFPEMNVSISEIRETRGVNVLKVSLIPIKYNYMLKSCNVLTRISYKVVFEDDHQYIQETSYKRYDYRNPTILNTVLNSNYFKINANNVQGLQDITEDYLIITTPKYKAAAEKIAKWKRNLGLNINIVCKETWNSPKQVRDTIKNYYSITNGNLKYLLIIGGINDIPSHKFYWTYNKEQKPIYTDACYRDSISSKYSYSDIMVGRLPVYNAEEAEFLSDKIINYEFVLNQNNPEFYTSGTHVVSFIDGNNYTYPDGISDNNSPDVSESIISVVKDNGYDMKRIYFGEEPDLEPMFFHSGHIMPDYVINQFSQEANPMRLVENINTGTSYVLYEGHGDEYSFSSIGFGVNHIDSLNNGEKQPILFSLGCSNGKYYVENNLTTSLLKKENGGFLSIIAPTESTYQNAAEFFILGIFDAIWPDKSLLQFYDPNNPFINKDIETPSPTFRLGQIFEQALIRSAETSPPEYVSLHDKVFHLFGDPSMLLFTGAPLPLENVIIKRINDCISISTTTIGDKKVCTINPETNDVKTYNFSSTEITIPYHNCGNAIVTIFGHNFVPYLDDPNEVLYIQNKSIKYDKYYKSKSVRVGSNVTEQFQSGDVYFDNGHTIIKADEVILDAGTTVNVGAELEILTPKNK